MENDMSGVQYRMDILSGDTKNHTYAGQIVSCMYNSLRYPSSMGAIILELLTIINL